MKYFKRSLGVILSLVLVLAMLTGCVYERMDTVVNADGSGTMKATIGFTKEAFDMMAASGGEMTGADMEDFTLKTINGKQYYVTEDVQEFASVEEFNELMAGDNEVEGSETTFTLKMERNSDKDFSLVINFDVPEQGLEITEGSEEDVDAANQMLEGMMEGMGMEASEEMVDYFVDDMVMELVFTFPTPMGLVKGNSDDAVSVKDNVVTLNLLGLPQDYVEGQHYEYIIKSLGNSSSGNKITVKSFSDVLPTAWYYNSVMRAVEKGIFQGVTQPDENGVGTFAPERKVTRAEFITTMVRCLGESPVTENVGSAWYDGYVKAAINKGLIDADTFGGEYNVPMTREEMAYVISRAATCLSIPLIETQEARDRIPDWYSINESYKNAVLKCYSAGILAGVNTKGTFYPTGVLTRAQAATVIIRLLDLQG